MDKIIVAGDLIRDYHLIQQPKEDKFNRDHLGKIRQISAPGGAWYLRMMIELSCGDKEPTAEQAKRRVEILEAVDPDKLSDDEKSCVNRSYSVWARHCDKLPEKGKCKSELWRTSTFLGYESANDVTVPRRIQNDAPDPRVLAIDDMGMGFRDHEELWPVALKEKGRPTDIVLKTYPPLADNALWRKLFRDHLDRLTVVVDVAALRLRRAVISRALSWDATIEEVIKEFRDGESSQDLARCRRIIIHLPHAGAAIFTRAKQSPASDGGKRPDESALVELAQLEQFIYHPEELEGAWVRERPGTTYGTSSIMTAAVVRHVLDPETCPLDEIVKRALAAQKVNHELGGGRHPEKLQVNAANELIGETFHPRAAAKASGGYTLEYYEVYPATLMSPPASEPQPTRPSLLSDLTGAGYESAVKTAIQVVQDGWEAALKSVPRARYGDYFTVDRDEIERINAIRSLIISYQKNPDDFRPLSIAVFGPPGSGKSFAIKQLAKELFKEQKAGVEFNLSQFKRGDHADLHTAFQRVRDASVQRQLPLVFWDEFDTDGLVWLKEFLEPMQDAKFQSNGQTYRFGQAIFIFAGGTCNNFEKFNKTNHREKKVRDDFRMLKGPDFVSRLRGYVNIKGPNPVLPSGFEEEDPDEGQTQSDQKKEVAAPALPAGTNPGTVYDIIHVIRRAVLLRSTLIRNYPVLINGDGKADIDERVINSFLRCKKFLHGARSLEAIVNMSALSDASSYSVAQLPTLDLLRLHVSDDFLTNALNAHAGPSSPVAPG